ncbi:MAG TPA: hypothetical protein VD837_16195 [Terriglobales bacterium]|nr:hypothetical protein [Terriglobales bacterium]
MIHSTFFRKRAVMSSVVLCMAVGFSGVAQNVSQRKVLDLNLARATEPAVRVVGGSGTGGGVGGPGILVNPIRLSLTHTDESRCQGGELEMQLEITNTTNQTIYCPGIRTVKRL